MSFPVISKQNPLILASASPRRKRLLTQIGLPFRSIKSHVTEENISGDPLEISRLLAEEKASQVHSKTGEVWVLGADTIVVIDKKILGKPQEKEEAKRMLNLLSGREHRVITGFCVLNPLCKVTHSEAVTTLVQIKNLSEQEIGDYISTGEPYGKAGSYAIQGIGSFMVKTISGSYSNVVGLPLCALINALISVGATKSFPLPRHLI
jgi:septum formation protein